MLFIGVSVVGVFKHVFGMGFFSLGVLPALFHLVSLFMFLSFSLFHLEGYPIRSNDQPATGMLSHFESQQSSKLIQRTRNSPLAACAIIV